MSNEQIARAFGISVRMVTVHVSNLLRKIGSASRTELSGLTKCQVDPEEGRRRSTVTQPRNRSCRVVRSGLLPSLAWSWIASCIATAR